MPVPNTTTFTLQNVVDEVNPTTDDLVDCFSDANSSGFDGTYSGNKDNLLNFRNYTHVTLTSYSSSAGQGSVFGVCDTSLLQTYYHDGSGSLPVTGDVCYSDSAGNNYLSAYFYKISSSSYIKIVSSTGDVALVGSCGEL
jgi:hypothetical protein